MTDERYAQITSYMRPLRLEWALRWCDAKACACSGAANCSGGLSKRGVTKLEWQQWWQRRLAEILT